jgi:hypothetical protein
MTQQDSLSSPARILSVPSVDRFLVEWSVTPATEEAKALQCAQPRYGYHGNRNQQFNDL